MENAIQTKDVNGKRVKVLYDDNPCNPRENDNTTTMVCFHNRYTLGDEGHGYDSDDYEGWEEMKEQIIKKEKPLIIKPLYLYDHSGITIATSPFSCRWDSGQIGFVYITKKNLKKMGCDPKKVDEILESEVQEYDKYLRGEGYMFEVVNLLEDDGEFFEGKTIEMMGGFNDVEECMKEGLAYCK